MGKRKLKIKKNGLKTGYWDIFSIHPRRDRFETCPYQIFPITLFSELLCPFLRTLAGFISGTVGMGFSTYPTPGEL